MKRSNSENVRAGDAAARWPVRPQRPLHYPQGGDHSLIPFPYVLRVLHSVKRVGFHAFRRFRLTWLRKNAVPKDLERFWMGHAAEDVGDLYSKLKEDVAFRQECAERIGLGFELVHIGPQNVVAMKSEKVA